MHSYTQVPGDSFHNIVPVAGCRLAVQPGGRTDSPWSERPAVPPAGEAIQNPDRLAQGPGKMHGGFVQADHQGQGFDQRSRVSEIVQFIGSSVQEGAKRGLAGCFAFL
jgi:hypothetical protein